MPKATESKPIQTMIEKDHPSWWIYKKDMHEFILIAETYSWENGNNRTKQVWRTSILNIAMEMNAYLEKNHKRYSARSFQDVMEDHYYETGEKVDGLFTREWMKNG